VIFRYFTDPNAMNNYMLTDQLDVISNVQAPQTLPEFRDKSKFVIADGTTNGEVVLSFNSTRGALKDKRVRQAINYAIDRKGLVKTVWAGYGQLIGSMVPPTDPWYQNLANRYPYDPAKAKALLAQAGYRKGLTLQLKLPTLPYATGAGQVLRPISSRLALTRISASWSFRPAGWMWYSPRATTTCRSSRMSSPATSCSTETRPIIGTTIIRSLSNGCSRRMPALRSNRSRSCARWLGRSPMTPRATGCTCCESHGPKEERHRNIGQRSGAVVRPDRGGKELRWLVT